MNCRMSPKDSSAAIASTIAWIAAGDLTSDAPTSSFSRTAKVFDALDALLVDRAVRELDARRRAEAPT